MVLSEVKIKVEFDFQYQNLKFFLNLKFVWTSFNIQSVYCVLKIRKKVIFF